MADTEHDIATIVAEQQREREGCEKPLSPEMRDRWGMVSANAAHYAALVAEHDAWTAWGNSNDLLPHIALAAHDAVSQWEREGVASNAAVARWGNRAIPGNSTNTAGVTTNPLRTEADWQQAERVIALLADEVADRSNCPRVAPWDAESVDCPAADYCIDHHPDSLPCEDATCPAVIAAWARERTDV